MTFVQQLEIFATQTGYRLTLSIRYGHIEVNEPFSVVEHGDCWLCGRLSLRKQRRRREFCDGVALLGTKEKTQENSAREMRPRRKCVAFPSVYLTFPRARRS